MNKIRFKYNYFYEKYAIFMSMEINVYEMISLTIRIKQLFDCNSNIITRNQCIDSINKYIYDNENFGICFEFFGNNRDINLKDKDYIEIVIKRETQRSILHLRHLFASFSNQSKQVSNHMII